MCHPRVPDCPAGILSWLKPHPSPSNSLLKMISVRLIFCGKRYTLGAGMMDRCLQACLSALMLWTPTKSHWECWGRDIGLYSCIPESDSHSKKEKIEEWNCITKHRTQNKTNSTATKPTWVLEDPKKWQAKLCNYLESWRGETFCNEDY